MSCYSGVICWPRLQSLDTTSLSRLIESNYSGTHTFLPPPKSFSMLPLHRFIFWFFTLVSCSFDWLNDIHSYSCALWINFVFSHETRSFSFFPGAGGVNSSWLEESAILIADKYVCFALFKSLSLGDWNKDSMTNDSYIVAIHLSSIWW